MGQELKVLSHNPQHTWQIGFWLGDLLKGGDIVCLSGELGAGKTALARGIGAGWGALEGVNSPTFVFVHEHRRARDSLRLYHLDCYRLASEGDALSIGLEDILASSDVTVIEWPERILSFLPDEHLWIGLEQVEVADQRLLTFRAIGTRYLTLLEELHRNIESGAESVGTGKMNAESRIPLADDGERSDL